MISGVLGAFTVAFSLVVKIKYNIFLFFPVFLLLTATSILKTTLFKGMFSVAWYDYISMFNDEIKNGYFFLISVIILIFFLWELSLSVTEGIVYD